MQKELKEKLNNLSNKFSTELDIISLKALCNMPESEEISFAITGTLNRLIEKYPDNNEILGLLPKKEKISLEELIKLLEKKYSGNVEVITIKALSALPEGETKENAVKQCLERLLQVNTDDEDIMEYLGINEKSLVKETVKKEQNPNMIFVEGGTYKPSFFEEFEEKEERTTFDLYVSKYDVTNDEWDELMNENPSKVLGTRKPVNNINRIAAFEFCNKMSEKYGLQPVYKIENNNLVKIIYKDGKEEYPNLADFRKTEGYRLPTEIEWEWFAWGGKVAQEQGKFDKRYFKEEEQDSVNLPKGLGAFAAFGAAMSATPPSYTEFAWYGKVGIHDVGLKRPNELGLYDVIGNVSQHIYDTALDGYIDETRLHIYDEKYSGRLRGGDCDGLIGNQFAGGDLYTKRSSSAVFGLPAIEKSGFRVVRTANPQK